MKAFIFLAFIVISSLFGKSFVDVEPLEVNLLSESSNRQLKIGISIAVENEALVKEINRAMPIVRDSVIRVMSSKTFEEISTQKGKDKVALELVTTLNKKLGSDGLVQNVYFTDFHLKNNLDALIRYIRQIDAKCL